MKLNHSVRLFARLRPFTLGITALLLACAAPANTAVDHAIPWSELGAKAGADYKGDELAVVSTAEGARLSCVFQRLEGEATREGLWLSSTVSNGVNERLRVVATAVGRQGGKLSTPSPQLPGPPQRSDGG